MPTIQIIRQADISPTIWSGGKTTQLLIFPKNSTYLDRNFIFRLSTATIETESATFTRLEGVKRSLMILRGSLKLEHKGHYVKEMKQFEVDNFVGDWESTSYGKVTDFNLMTTGQANGFLESLKMEKNGFFEFQNTENYRSIAYYVWEGSAMFSCGNTEYGLQTQELIWLNDLEKNVTVKIKTQKYAELLGAFIRY